MRLRAGDPLVRGPRVNQAQKHRSKLARPSVEPSTFAWVEPLANIDPIVVERKVETPIYIERTSGSPKTGIISAGPPPAVAVAKSTKPEQPKAIIIGRGPGLAAKLARLAPNPSPVLAGASALLIALVGIALISPSSDNATAQRSTSAFIDDPAIESAGASIEKNDKSIDERASGEGRDPFAAKDYEAPQSTTATGKDKPEAKKSTKAKQAADAKTRAAAPAASTLSQYKANLIVYSSYTPWTKISKPAGGWIDFNGEPTVKLIAVGKESIELFVVTDVEVLDKKSRNIEYDNPLRQVRVAKGGIVRFADYRNIQGDDVTYTIRYSGSNKVVVKSKN